MLAFISHISLNTMMERFMRCIRKVALLTASVTMATVAFMATPNTAFADDGDTVTTSEVAAALNATEAGNGDLVAEPVKSTTDTNSAAIVTKDGTTTDVPKDPEDGVSLGNKGESPVTIGLPNADEAGDAKRLSDGTVVYPGTDGSAQAVVPTDTGVQMLTTIANADAPTRYTYKVDVPDGGKVAVNENGNAAVLDADGSVVLAVPTAWAKDANGTAVPTHFETDGRTLTQVVNHTSGNYTYPVVADPRWIDRTWYGALIIHYTRDETNRLASGATLAGIAFGRWWMAGVGFGLAGWWATNVYNSGQCLAAYVWPGNAAWWWSERC